MNFLLFFILFLKVSAVKRDKQWTFRCDSIFTFINHLLIGSIQLPPKLLRSSLIGKPFPFFPPECVLFLIHKATSIMGLPHPGPCMLCSPP
ncbi:hypothetical protein BDZ91DRAFT_43489 [Kalaharituber pfeilii]|nr:hypothetical protein BDZ91DRAFT_43489 [Kalaharituber pfeilii]